MDYFDGTEEELKRSGSNVFGRTYWIRSFSSGSTPFRLSWAPLKGIMMLTVIMTLVLLGVFLSIGLLMGDTFILTVLLVAGLVMFVSFAGFMFLILFIAFYASAGKLLKNNKTSLANDGIGIRFQSDINLPEQLTMIPYRYLVNIHPITDEEWTRELGMGSFFRRLGGKPKDIPNVRFPRGCRWPSVYVLQMSGEMPIKSLKKKVGAFGKLGALTLSPMLAYYDQYIDENKGRCSKIFFSLKHEEYDDFVRLLDQARSRGS
jgi:hypothetical protein